MPPESVVFFIDRSVGKHVVPDALREAGALVEVHDDHFPQDAQDADWLIAVGARSWVVITSDRNIRRNRLEREALLRANLRVFIITSGSMRAEETAQTLVASLPKMLRLIRRTAPPFIASVGKSGVRPYTT